MITTKKLQQTSRVAGKNELYSIIQNIFTLPGTTNLHPRARRYLFFMISVVKSGYHRIAAPMAVIADAIYRAQGQTASVRTLRTALAELESAGFLSRRKYRFGENRSLALIDLHPERFIYWTKIKHGNILPYATSSHNSTQRQMLPSDDPMILSNGKNRVNTPKYSKLKKKPRASARSKKSAKKHQYHPIIYTLLCIIPESPLKSKMINIATQEINGDKNISGIDWQHYERLWPALDPLPGGRREITAKQEILFLLSRAATLPHFEKKEPFPSYSVSSDSSILSTATSSLHSLPSTPSANECYWDSFFARVDAEEIVVLDQTDRDGNVAGELEHQVDVAGELEQLEHQIDVAAAPTKGEIQKIIAKLSATKLSATKSVENKKMLLSDEELVFLRAVKQTRKYQG